MQYKLMLIILVLTGRTVWGTVRKQVNRSSNAQRTHPSWWALRASRCQTLTWTRSIRHWTSQGSTSTTWKISETRDASLLVLVLELLLYLVFYWVVFVVTLRINLKSLSQYRYLTQKYNLFLGASMRGKVLFNVKVHFI